MIVGEVEILTIANWQRTRHADVPHPISLLRVSIEPPSSSGAAKKVNELSPLHSITLVGAGEQRGRDRKAERLGGLEVEHQLELGGLQNG